MVYDLLALAPGERQDNEIDLAGYGKKDDLILIALQQSVVGEV